MRVEVSDLSSIAEWGNRLVRYVGWKFKKKVVPDPPRNLVTSLMAPPERAEYVFWMWPGADDDPYVHFEPMAELAMSLRPRASQVLFFGPEGANKGYPVSAWLIDGERTLASISVNAVGLFQRYRRSLHIWVAHSYGAAVALDCLARAPEEMRERTLLLTFAGLCWLPRGSGIQGLESLESSHGSGLHVESIYSLEDPYIPEVVTRIPGAPSFCVPMGAGEDAHNGILRHSRALKHGRSAMEHYVEAMYSLTERRHWRELMRAGAVPAARRATALA